MRKIIIVAVVLLATTLPLQMLYAYGGNYETSSTKQVYESMINNDTHVYTVTNLYFNKDNYRLYIQYSDATQYYIEVNGLEDEAPGELIIDDFKDAGTNLLSSISINLRNPANMHNYTLYAYSMPITGTNDEAYVMIDEENPNIRFRFDIEGIYVLSKE